MKKIFIADTTLCRENGSFSFKERIEIARQLERLNVDTIELPEIKNQKTDVLLVRTVSSFVKHAVLSVCAGITRQSVEDAAAALSAAANPRIRIELPVSPVGMEYSCHKKPPKMLDSIREIISYAKEKCNSVEFCAVDATRAEPDFLNEAIRIAGEAGATSVSICDSAARMLPDDFAAFIEKIVNTTSLSVGVRCDNRNGLASAQAILAVKAGVCEVKTAIGGNTVDLTSFADMVKNCGNDYGFSSDIRCTELHRITKQIEWIRDNSGHDNKAAAPASAAADSLLLDGNDTLENVLAAVNTLGYDLSEEDSRRVYEEFLRVAAKKRVGAKELDAIVASTALQVPAAYKLESYVINNGNIISSSAQITLSHDGKSHQGICIGDGPIDAAFRAIEQIIGCHYELDDFQIQSVTEGKEAVGSALVKLRFGGKLYSGNGISTDIIGASIRAYLGAVNKIVYEEAQS
ncbi:MAG: hypothetical protein MJ102_03410 [Clostridia bacterium]|nr:hypothetical protein [Clostridia bacterium]